MVVVDNGSTDGSRGWSQRRRGRVAADGRQPRATAGPPTGGGDPGGPNVPYLLVCNPDLELGPGAVPTLVAALEADPSLGVVGPGLWNNDGSLYPSARTFPDMVDAIGHGLFGMVAPGNRFTRRYRLLDWDHGQQARVDWVSGACLLCPPGGVGRGRGLRPRLFHVHGGRGPVLAAPAAGWAVGYEPAARVRHVQGASTNQHPYRMLAAHHRSMWRFAWRTTTGSKRAVLPVVAVGLAGRLAVAAVDHRLRRSGPPGLAAGGPGDGSGPQVDL